MSEFFEGGKYKVWCVLLQQFLTCFCLVGFFVLQDDQKKRILNLRSIFYALWGQRWPLIIIVGCRPFLLHLLKAGYSLPPFSWGFRISNEIRLPINQPDNQQNERVFFVAMIASYISAAGAVFFFRLSLHPRKGRKRAMEDAMAATAKFESDLEEEFWSW